MEGRAATFELDFTPPLDWPFFLRFLGARATPGVEAVDRGRYVRTVEVDGAVGKFVVEPHPTFQRLLVTVQGEAATQARAVLGRVRRMFDLDVDLPSVHATLGADPLLRPLLDAAPGIRIPGAWSAFELLVRAIVGQQVAVKAATTIMGRIVGRLGTPVDGGGDAGPSFLFPSPRAVAEGDLSSIGMPTKRALALQNVARAIAGSAIPFPEAGGVVDGVKEALIELPGIGPWTVEYFALRALGDADAWPGTDLILRRAIEPHSDSATTPRGPACWRPYRGYAAMHLWNRAAQEATRSQGPVRGEKP